MKTYSIALFTGDLTKPLERTLLESDGELFAFWDELEVDQECSVIITESKGDDKVYKRVFFGKIGRLISQEMGI